MEVGLPNQARRFVFAAAREGVRAAAEANSAPFVFLKVCAPAEAVRPRLPPGWEVVSESAMMTVELARAAPGVAPPGYASTGDRDGGAWRVRMLDADGALAASGRITLPRPGMAVFDRIETDLAHRRRGLGRSVMAELGGIALSEGAETGLLVATPDGRALYETLGWTVHAPYASALWTGAAR